MRDFESVELRDEFAQTFDTADFFRDVLPREEEAHEVGGGNRLDLGAQAVQRVAMDACEQPAVAPFQFSAILECPAENHAFGFEFDQRRVGF